MKLALTLVIAVYLAGASALFFHNLPRWCATPEVGGNHIVQPLCK